MTAGLGQVRVGGKKTSACVIIKIGSLAVNERNVTEADRGNFLSSRNAALA